MKGTFAALSHRWGDTMAARTTRKNFAQHKEFIPLDEKSQTFIDAISLCEKLCIDFLWIDSLCIIQHEPDDPLSTDQDFLKEVKLMGGIYGRAALTIAATGAAEDPAIGLFGANRARLASITRIPYRLKATDKPDGYFNVSFVPESFKKEVVESPLLSRGWILQERLLSSRYIHFGREQWFWQCREATLAQVDGQSGINGWGAANLKLGADMGMLKYIRAPPNDFNQWWTQVVETYSRLGFLLARDRLIALQGLMSEIKRQNDKQYALGIWLESLHAQLLWIPVPGFEPAADEPKPEVGHDGKTVVPKIHDPSPIPRPPVQRAPSWSWLSYDNPIVFPCSSNDSSRLESGPDSFPEEVLGKKWQESKIKWKFKVVDFPYTASPAKHIPQSPPRTSRYPLLELTGQMKPAYIRPWPRRTDPIPSISRLDLTDRLGPLSILAFADSKGGDKVLPSYFRHHILDPNDDVFADPRGFCELYDYEPDEDPEDAFYPVECLRVSDDWERHPGGAEGVVSINLVLLRRIKGPSAAAFEFPVYRKVGVGETTDSWWFLDGRAKTVLVS